MSHTYAILDISRAAYNEIAKKLRDAGYGHCFDGEVIDMHGIALQGTGCTCTRIGGFPESVHLPGCPVYDTLPDRSSIARDERAAFEDSNGYPMPDLDGAAFERVLDQFEVVNGALMGGTCPPFPPGSHHATDAVLRPTCCREHGEAWDARQGRNAPLSAEERWDAVARQDRSRLHGWAPDMPNLE